MPKKDQYEFLKKEVERKIKKQLGEAVIENETPEPILTRQYTDFKQDYFPKHLSFYEKGCNLAEKIMNVKADKKQAPALKEAIDICHLNITANGVASFGLLMPILVIVLGIVVGFFIPWLLYGTVSLLLIGFFLVVGVVLMAVLNKLPYFLSNSWRLKASNQMVLAVFYIVTYMRHTSNLELAVDFAAEHLAPPLSLDLKKVIWNIETERYESIKESLDNYLETWKKWNMEFIESMHLIESSLYENAEARRVTALDKALQVMLDETYEKMLHYAHGLKSPLTTLHMLGIVLPILGLVILPLAVSFIPEVEWIHLFLLYDVTLPVIVYYLAKMILSKRPTGYGNVEMTDINPALNKYKYVLIKMGKGTIKVHPIFLAVAIIVVLFFAGLAPIMLFYASSDPENGIFFDVIIDKDFNVKRISSLSGENARFYLLGYREEIVEGIKTGKVKGPFGLGATLIGLLIPLSFGLGIGTYNKLRSKNLVKIRDQTKKLEQEFAAALFQLGNRLGDGLPAEIAFAKVAKVMEGTNSGNFFSLVSVNIRKLGMGIEEAIFDPDKGALTYYPSNLIESSMKVLVESAKKGPVVASNALINISEYIKQMHRVDERLKDLMGDTISSMKSQVKFLTPAIAGVVIGITSMITTILGTLTEKLQTLGADAAGGEAMGSTLLSMFGLGVPTYFFQVIVGIYIVEIVIILTLLVNGIENGSDKLYERHMLGSNLINTTMLYCAIALVVMIIFNSIAGTIVTSVGPT
ncbi:MAG: hypothetical protein ABIE94_01675 [archaeon]